MISQLHGAEVASNGEVTPTLPELRSALGKVADLEEYERVLGRLSIEETLDLLHEVKALYTWTVASGQSREIQNCVAICRLKAERKLGRYLMTLQLRGGDRKSKNRNSLNVLQGLRITPSQSKLWQREARVSERAFQNYVRVAIKESRKLSSAGLIRSEPLQSHDTRTSRHRGRLVRPANPDLADRVELLDELTNHSQLLADILLPFCDTTTSSQLKTGERKGLRHLIGEIIRTSEALTRIVQRDLAAVSPTTIKGPAQPFD